MGLFVVYLMKFLNAADDFGTNIKSLRNKFPWKNSQYN